MKSFKQWNYGDSPMGILPSIKKAIITYEKAARLSFDYAFSHHAQARLLCKDLITKTIEIFQELATVVEYFYHWLCLK